jgi:hypothetical protein
VSPKELNRTDAERLAAIAAKTDVYLGLMAPALEGAKRDLWRQRIVAAGLAGVPFTDHDGLRDANQAAQTRARRKALPTRRSRRPRIRNFVATRGRLVCHTGRRSPRSRRAGVTAASRDDGDPEPDPHSLARQRRAVGGWSA